MSSSPLGCDFITSLLTGSARDVPGFTIPWSCKVGLYERLRTCKSWYENEINAKPPFKLLLVLHQPVRIITCSES